MEKQLYVCKSVDRASASAVYLIAISREGGHITTQWSDNRAEAMTVTAEKRNQLLEEGFRGRGFGRWVRA